jgi:hypothetical protein
MGKTKDIREAVEAALSFDPLVSAAWMANSVVRDDLAITS